ncbi:hypothetical protein AVEN_234787-1 [Araneus ventricosus]|uniref:Uncharacterized protein n=1 Tax=Araneus ventricosus TaxID=182803 RepID=A0A4Y2F7H8_ARAVE|nr:hypothetical protein AVEN_234787-1 [Araneus ventricosus]
MQCIKYELHSQKKSAVSMFSKHDFLKEKVDPKLVKNVRNSRNVYFDKLKQNKSLREERIKELNASKEKALTKKAAKKLSADATKRQRMNHKKKLTCDLKRLLEPNFNGGENVNESKSRKVEDKSKSEAVKNINSEQSLKQHPLEQNSKTKTTNDTSEQSLKQPLIQNLKNKTAVAISEQPSELISKRNVKIKKYNILTIKEMFLQANIKNKK